MAEKILPKNHPKYLAVRQKTLRSKLGRLHSKNFAKSKYAKNDTEAPDTAV